MAKITPDELLDAMKQMTGEQLVEFNRIQCDATSAEQWIEMQKFFYLKLGPKQRWEQAAWQNEQSSCVEERYVVQTITWPDGTMASNASTQKHGYGKGICE